MERNNQEMAGSESLKGGSMEALIHEHRVLDEKVTELADQHILSPEQDVELSRLKKEKLRLKDRIADLTTESASA